MDLRQIEDQGKALGLFLNVDKSEMMSHNGSSVNPVLSAFPDLQYVHAYYAVLLGSGSVGLDTMCFLHYHRLKLATGEPQSFPYLLQRLRCHPDGELNSV